VAFDWLEYLELARQLVDPERPGYPKEAAERSAVSRAYYAVFCWLRSYAEKNMDFKPKRDPSDHSLLRKHLKNRGHECLASDLNRLRMLRNACDYNDEVSQLRLQVDYSFRLADEIIHKLS
jgi:uncharacterized protein (UPF0332 family)